MSSEDDHEWQEDMEWKKVDMIHLKVLSQHSFGQTEENYKKQ
jgi:hypothetical protein